MNRNVISMENYPCRSLQIQGATKGLYDKKLNNFNNFTPIMIDFNQHTSIELGEVEDYIKSEILQRLEKNGPRPKTTQCLGNLTLGLFVRKPQPHDYLISFALRSQLFV